jgi:Uncharacterized conserved protein (DUF2293)
MTRGAFPRKRPAGITLGLVSKGRALEPRVVAAAEETLARRSVVTPIDICLTIGWLQPPNVDDWQHGRVDDLDYFLPTHDDRSVAFLVHLKDWAITKGLKPVEAEYVSATRSRRPLRFSSLDEQAITLAVVASIRHQDTDYDDLLMSGVAREDARSRIRPTIDVTLATWSTGSE